MSTQDASNETANGHGEPKASSMFPWIVWGIGAAFFCFGFFLRVAPSVMVTELMRDFAVGGALVGNLSAFYFYAYAGMQVPMGVLLDRWPGRVLTTAIAVCATGCLVFALAPTLYVAYAGRFLIGAGAASAWIGSLKMISLWFPTNRFARVSGLTIMLGMAGGVGGQAPLAAIVDVAGWRETMMSGAAFGALLAVIAWFVLWRRESSPTAGGDPTGSLFHRLAGVARTPQTWIIALIIAAVTVPLLAVVGLWGVPYLMVAYGLERPIAAASTSLFLIGWGLGAPTLGWLSDRLRRRKMPMLIGSAVCFAAMLSVIYVPGVTLPMAQVLLFVSGFAGSAAVIAYATARENNRSDAVGATMGTVNLVTMTLSALSQPLIGWLLDLNWDGRLEAGARVYSLAAYHAAFTTLIACAIVAVIAALFTRETYCRPLV
jgi:MFS family permease